MCFRYSDHVVHGLCRWALFFNLALTIMAVALAAGSTLVARMRSFTELSCTLNTALCMAIAHAEVSTAYAMGEAGVDSLA